MGRDPRADWTRLDNRGRIADVIVAENGKTKADAMGDVFRGIEVCLPRSASLELTVRLFPRYKTRLNFGARERPGSPD
jgi:hypothetical protein